jgi:hypothetical protein
MASEPAVSSPRAAILASCSFLLSGALAGSTLRVDGIEYRLFGMTEGVFALFLLYLLVQRRIWSQPVRWDGWLVAAYGFWATAQLLQLLLPPPGLLEWIVVPALVLAAWAALLGTGSRERLVASLGVTAVLLALVNFSIVPALWASSEAATETAFGVGSVARGLRQLVVAYEPVAPATHLLGVLSIALWGLGTRLIWPPD